MAKVNAQDIIDLGFDAEMFRKNDTAFLDMLKTVIAEQSLLLQGRIGSSVYAVVTSPAQDYIKRAEKCTVAAELVQRRINIILSNAVGAGVEINVAHEGAQKKAYKDEADNLILTILAGATTDSAVFSSGTIITDHFTGPNA